jgi:hypothetical protein
MHYHNRQYRNDIARHSMRATSILALAQSRIAHSNWPESVNRYTQEEVSSRMATRTAWHSLEHHTAAVAIPI